MTEHTAKTSTGKEKAGANNQKADKLVIRGTKNNSLFFLCNHNHHSDLQKPKTVLYRFYLSSLPVENLHCKQPWFYFLLHQMLPQHLWMTWTETGWPAGLGGLHHPSVKEEAAFRKKEACSPQYSAPLSRQIYCTSCFYVSENPEKRCFLKFFKLKTPNNPKPKKTNDLQVFRSVENYFGKCSRLIL